MLQFNSGRKIKGKKETGLLSQLDFFKTPEEK